MWTPKRVLLLVAGFLCFFTSYGVYAHFLGGIDGLPPLPEDYWPVANSEEVDLPRSYLENVAEHKLRMAFGENEKVKNCAIKLEIGARGLVMASEQVQPGPDGRLKLVPFYLAIFGKDKGDGGFVEINTVQSKEAYLTFDPPIRSITDMSRGKIVAGELQGDIYIVNNRRTPEQHDDISMFTHGPLFYQESLHLIWTNADVRVVDPQSKPEPTTITGTGLDLVLTTETKPDKPAAAPARKPKSEMVNGVDRIRLRSDVNMNLWVDSRSGFLGSTKPEATPAKAPAAAPGKTDPAAKPAAPATPAEPEKAKVVIMTQGPFSYDLRTNEAMFDISQHPSPRPNNVEVTRINGPNGPEEKREHLVCDHLHLLFNRKNADANAKQDGQAVNLEIQTAHATGGQVTLTSDTENLDAFGNDLTYDARNGESVLRGDPEMVAMKDGNEIYAREMKLRMDGKGLQEVTAKGPGHIKMLDRAKGERNLQAHWKDVLISSKEGVYDLLLLKGDAGFDDTEHGQQIEGDLIKVWLEPAERDATSGKDAQRRPHQLEAVGHVHTVSPEVRVRDSERLAMWFKDAPAGGQLPPALPASPAPAAPAGPPATSPAPAAAPAKDGATPATPAPAAASAAAAPAEAPKKKPIDLTARSIEAYVLRSAGKNDLDRLWCEGAVHVHQDPSSPEDKGVEIRGDTLQLAHHIEGNILAVTGDLAQVQLDKLSILGPEVNIDQRANKAWVNGIGAMRLPSDKNFDGKKLANAADLIVHWNHSMFFNGKQAEFFGGVQAEQENAHLLCQTMSVTLDRTVSLREGEKGQQPAKVQTLLCDRSVQVEDVVQNGSKLESYKRINSQQLTMDNDGEDSIVNAPGPGEVRILQMGSKGDGLPVPSASATPPAAPRPNGTAPAEEQEMKLTWVRYGGKMFGNNQKRTVTFYDNVEVVNVPSDDPALPIDLDHLPPGALYLSCEKLDVYTSRDLDGRTTQEMVARKKVRVQAQDFWGRASLVKYDEAKDQIIFEGGDGTLATLSRVKAQGGKPEEIVGKKIIYWRKTGKFDVIGGQRIDFGN